MGELSDPQADPALWQATFDYFTRAASDESGLSWLAENDPSGADEHDAAEQGAAPQIVAAGTLALFVRPLYERIGFIANKAYMELSIDAV